MAKIVSGFPANRTARAKYPFVEWFDGQTRLLTQGEDFVVPVNSFRGAMYAAAKRHGIKTRMAVGTDIKTGNKTVTIQALNPEVLTQREAQPAPEAKAEVKSNGGKSKSNGDSNMEDIIKAAVEAAIASVTQQSTNAS